LPSWAQAGRASELGGFRLAGQSATERFDQGAGVFRALMGQMQVDHGRIDLLVPEQPLDGVEAGPGFDEMGGEAVSQGMSLMGMRYRRRRM